MRVWKPTTRRQPRSANVARVSRRVVGDLGIRRRDALEDRDATAEVERLLVVEPRDAGMLGVGRAEALLGLALLVVLEHLLHLERREQAALLVGEGDDVALRRLVHRQADGQRPGQAGREPHAADDRLRSPRGP